MAVDSRTQGAEWMQGNGFRRRLFECFCMSTTADMLTVKTIVVVTILLYYKSEQVRL